MTLLKAVAKIPLDALAFFLKHSPAALYYLVNEPLRENIKATNELAFAYQHIENAIEIVKNSKNGQNTDGTSRSNREGGVILDVGGGTATTASLFSKAFPKHKLYIFEPIPTNFKEIEQSKYRTEKWQLVNKAVGSKIGETEMHIANRITASSLLDLNPEKVEGLYADVLREKSTLSIQITTIEHEIPKNVPVDILKMDVQGYEMEVLKGCGAVLNNIKLIVLEINNHDGFKEAPTYFEIDEFMRNNNFELYDLLPNYREAGKLLDWDAIYVNKTLKA
jgi:FkbM family methyltransferase